MAEEIERIFVIPLKKIGFKSSKAAPTAVKRVKSYLTRHMKVEEEKIWIDDSLNNALWNHGKYSMGNKIRVKAVKFEDGVVEAYLPELEFKKSRREILREEREKKEPILRKDADMEPGEGEDISGTEDYDIAPGADGEVKIKKKKAPKDKADKSEKKEEKTKEEKKEKKTTSKQKTTKTTKKSTTKKKTAAASKKSSSKTTTKKKPAAKKK